MENPQKADTGDTIKNTFYNLLQVRGIFSTIGIGKTVVSRYRKEAEEGKYPSDKTMRSLLIKAGYKIVQEELWSKAE